jgi:hypothetical protein
MVGGWMEACWLHRGHHHFVLPTAARYRSMQWSRTSIGQQPASLYIINFCLRTSAAGRKLTDFFVLFHRLRQFSTLEKHPEKKFVGARGILLPFYSFTLFLHCGIFLFPKSITTCIHVHYYCLFFPRTNIVSSTKIQWTKTVAGKMPLAVKT